MSTYTTWLPLIATLISVVIYGALPAKPALVGEDGLATSLLTLVSTLPGFYFAGLAAIATFASTSIDKEMPSPAPTIDILVDGKIVKDTPLTRRLFLSYLFSYLVILSLSLCFALVIINASSGAIDAFHTFIVDSIKLLWLWLLIKAIVGFTLTFAFASMVVSTLHGVFFLTEKIHQP